ncbi:rhsE element core RshE domain protein [Escherichia coli BCE002_MS12]|nr:rhsE element core RshE domain protein [Escherichia coli BCE002_MS12]
MRRTQRYQYDLTGKLTQSEERAYHPLAYDASTDHPTVNGDPADSGSMMTRVANHHQPYQ